MKKLLAFLLVLVMILSISLVACDKKAAVSDDDDDDDAWGNGSGVTDNNNNNDDNNGDEPKDPDPVIPATWVDKNDTVYAGLNGVRLRSAPNTTTSSQVALVNVGTPLARLQSNGTWDKISYNDQEVYVLSALVSTISTNFTANIYENPEDYVTLTIVGTNAINLRSTPFVPGGNYAYENVVIESLKASNGGTLTKVGVTTSGNWYVVTYSGTIGSTTYENEVLYMSASSVTLGYVNDPSVPSGGGSGGIG